MPRAVLLRPARCTDRLSGCVQAYCASEKGRVSRLTPAYFTTLRPTAFSPQPQPSSPPRKCITSSARHVNSHLFWPAMLEAHSCGPEQAVRQRLSDRQWREDVEVAWHVIQKRTYLDSGPTRSICATTRDDAGDADRHRPRPGRSRIGSTRIFLKVREHREPHAGFIMAVRRKVAESPEFRFTTSAESNGGAHRLSQPHYLIGITQR
jgi:hypothetical protein